MKQTKTHVSDAKDTRKKVSRVREMASGNAAFAVIAARKIAENPALLNG